MRSDQPIATPIPSNDWKFYVVAGIIGGLFLGLLLGAGFLLR